MNLSSLFFLALHAQAEFLAPCFYAVWSIAFEKGDGSDNLKKNQIYNIGKVFICLLEVMMELNTELTWKLFTLIVF